ncbi:AlpA family transcriptional regulator [Rhodobacteraceae bacterium CH30]|nr:AlpA family transcriptional regulator [Rhodobacteraceae bacterium CH30]
MNQAAFFMRLPDVMARTGLSKTTIYALIKSATFPAPVPLGARAVGWVSTEIDGWMADRLKAAGRKVA